MKRLSVYLLVAGLFLNGMCLAETFREVQATYPRVRKARAAASDSILSLFKKAGVDYPPTAVFLRAFKAEQQLELWASGDSAGIYHLITTYDFTAFSGKLGAKRCQGDLQIPEGIYSIDRFNPASRFHLSLGLNYPNKSDRARASCSDPGGDIFIHGNAVTIGCIPLGDEAIEELYIIAVDTKSGGQERIPVHIFPFRMSEQRLQAMKEKYTDRTDIVTLWSELYPIYSHFEASHTLPTVSIDSRGVYSKK